MNPHKQMITDKPRIPIKNVLLYGLLPSFLKIFIYRMKGYKIGKSVSIGFGSVVIGESVDIGNDTSIGFLTIIRGSTIILGKHVKIGSTTFIDTPILKIGDGTKINEQVFVGGLQFPDSSLTVGRNCQIMQMSFINPTRSITIGDDTGIGGHSLIFGHTSWLSKFEGYPVEFKSIEIGNSVSVAWRVFILPGTTIGDGAVIGANSLVYRKIPPKSLAVGFPARVVTKPPDFPKNISQSDRVGFLQEIVEEMNQYLAGYQVVCRTVEPNHFEFTHRKRNFFRTATEKGYLQVWYEPVSEDSNIILKTGTVYLSLEVIPDSLRQNIETQKSMWVDIANKERSEFGTIFGEEVVQFLRRYGVRFYRCQAL